VGPHENQGFIKDFLCKPFFLAKKLQKLYETGCKKMKNNPIPIK
jgi:hypothetical protein